MRRRYEPEEVAYVAAVAKAIGEIPLPAWGGDEIKVKVKFWWGGVKLDWGVEMDGRGYDGGPTIIHERGHQ